MDFFKEMLAALEDASKNPFLLYFLPIALGVVLLEGVVLSALGRRYDWRLYLTSLGDVLGRNLIWIVLPFNLADPAIRWAEKYQLFPIRLDTVFSWILLFVVLEFFYYWFHRASHRIRWFWATHVVHHSPNELNLAASYRFGWTSHVSGAPIFFVPLICYGFSAETVFSALGANLLYQFWIHAAWMPKLRWLGLVLNTPSHHRVHHAANPEYLDANFGGALIVFDRLFGTFVPERDDLPCRYGLVEPVRTYNIFAIEFGEWGAILEDLRAARNWNEVLGYLFGPPGWRPEEKEEAVLATLPA